MNNIDMLLNTALPYMNEILGEARLPVFVLLVHEGMKQYVKQQVFCLFYFCLSAHDLSWSNQHTHSEVTPSTTYFLLTSHFSLFEIKLDYLKLNTSQKWTNTFCPSKYE